MAQFTILGETGSGKTCYLVGMYSEMAAGIGGYSIIAKNDEDDLKLQDMYDRMYDSSLGADRFPAASDQAQKYEFKLQYGFRDIMPFSWLDYPGGIIRAKGSEDEVAYNTLKEHVKESSTLFVCIDGEKLKGNRTSEKLRKIRRTTQNINKFLADYLNEDNKVPAVGIIITKFDCCCEDTNKDEIEKIIRNSISPLFTEEAKAFVVFIPVSLGSEIADYGNSNIEPLNIHMPIAMGIYFALLNKYNDDFEYYELGKMQEEVCRETIKKDGFISSINGDAVKHKNELEDVEYKNMLLEAELDETGKNIKKLYDEINELYCIENGKTLSSFPDFVERIRR